MSMPSAWSWLFAGRSYGPICSQIPTCSPATGQAGPFLRGGKLDGSEDHPAATLADAQRFLDAPSGGTENSEGEVGIYRYRELNGQTETFVLESLLPGTGYDVHLSKMKLRGEGEPERKPIRWAARFSPDCLSSWPKLQ